MTLSTPQSSTSISGTETASSAITPRHLPVQHCRKNLRLNSSQPSEQTPSKRSSAGKPVRLLLSSCDHEYDLSVRQLQEKCWEMRTQPYSAFVDLTKAFDTVSREGLWKDMQKFGCPERFTQMMRQIHDGMMAPSTSTNINLTTVTIRDVDLVHTCPQCDRTFTSHIGPLGHLRIHRTEAGEPVPGAPTYTRRIRLHYPHCPSVFVQRMGFLGHIRVYESGIRRSLETSGTSCTPTMPSPTQTPPSTAPTINGYTTAAATITETDTDTADCSC
ncbi:hypothetical protein SprV_0301176400 [Sparganum proliferum]